ncbi:CpsD/CapB family tyrosine-protein kinase [Staphylococcus simiae]|uniref:CpsD/CapB family tyrosine-protein kinase n=1 Tax=Staphylococcus simiae TaxID=308354 RepID=UPI001A9A1257|nr:CpsD/CapB family tyrosine-protein kinase [Staphylococcus simiae]MBO1198297.1 CpsD/CapB family tyrosine-protein kinase [Staphylococcus simiae]MBO1201968.1 CpsD/CapB family tyrosine-protein kinase [Staphylococcus simiae]MBO1204200.1 CpsD/CapB family tyrosine-protein kinase [Staphylococcus simiae]MBO1210289.1 CpsD/CapB family tyrosine-protein kinase [Staphylococcus simiae]MBO1230434.1 CpsD/CapB family tyrosine-protein kinase [Staphylococcus simiae]
MNKKQNRYINKQEQLMNEQIKILRTNLTFNIDERENTIYMITSSRQGEGKTTVSKQLVQSLADTDYKVLIIDADMRRPKIHKRFSFNNNYGLSNVISNQVTFDKALIYDEKTNVDVLTAGTMPPNPSELLDSKNFIDFLDHIKDIYDYIIIDTPPILPVTDALVIGKLVDKTILVINSKATPKDVVVEAKERLDNLNIPIFGVVLNQVNKSKSNGYY